MGQIPRNDLISQLDLYCVVVRTASSQVLVTQCARKIIGEKNFGELNAIRQIRQSFLLYGSSMLIAIAICMCKLFVYS